jgi:hypothetical protein
MTRFVVQVILNWRRVHVRKYIHILPVFPANNSKITSDSCHNVPLSQFECFGPSILRHLTPVMPYCCTWIYFALKQDFIKRQRSKIIIQVNFVTQSLNPVNEF